ncbi:hypothetical protein Ocin01_02900 [Orchesella cincta]|uniref:Uncharacterized protein n=1 Tax=Orchesella cincta TaxID=48709 RepID=A0A1D2NEU4_ORCCI|nr:hypothetical protein Ocin01_02900 [Orchesella cincta]
MLTLGTRGAGIFIGGTERNATNNATATFECHPLGERHGSLLLGLASAGVIANVSLAGLILARKSLRRLEKFF